MQNTSKIFTVEVPFPVVFPLQAFTTIFTFTTSILGFLYCVVSFLSGRPVDEQWRQLVVRFYSTWYFASYQKSIHCPSRFSQHWTVTGVCKSCQDFLSVYATLQYTSKCHSIYSLYFVNNLKINKKKILNKCWTTF